MKKIIPLFLLAFLASAGSFAADSSARNSRAPADSGRAGATTRAPGASASVRTIPDNSAANMTADLAATAAGTVAARSAQSGRASGAGLSGVTARTIISGSANNGAATRSGAAVSGRAYSNAFAERAAPQSNTASRATVARVSGDGASVISNTRTGAEYEKCKSAYFTCMDQFCAMKDSNFQRCSCSDRVYDLKSTQSVVQDAADQLTVFNNNLDTIGMTAAQATAMRIASEGENALTKDSSASKQLLQAIMNSIKGEDATVGGRMSDLNTINIRLDTAASFGFGDAGQTIATYNGKSLYTAIYGQCRAAVKPDCNDAALQRAVTAYLMAVEQDCNTVQKVQEDNQKKLSTAVRESNAMVTLARVENRQQHNSSTMTECMHAVEAAVLSDQVCGANYRKCLDNGQYIDIQTGEAIIGVVDFYKLGQQLTFNDQVSLSDQKLAKITNNRGFVKNFESRVKKFAEPALDKCVEKSADVWADYLDKAMLDIYYAQLAKVAEIKEGCLDFVSACYMNGEKSLTNSMTGIINKVLLTPDFITVNETICKEYVASCNNMFMNPDGDGIIEQYIAEKTSTDTLAACRAVVQQCFDQYGGLGYVNYYNPGSGLFLMDTGTALDWFTLYEADANGVYKTGYVSKCAQQLAEITSCSSTVMIEKVFGGFDKRTVSSAGEPLEYPEYGLASVSGAFDSRAHRYTGVATEVYNKIIDSLSVQCGNVYGRFVEKAFLTNNMYLKTNPCKTQFSETGQYSSLVPKYNIGISTGIEDMCPAYYADNVDTMSWGACLCWENGGRRSDNGTSVQCSARTRNAGGTFVNAYVNVNGKVCPGDASRANICCDSSYGAGSYVNTCMSEFNMELVPDAVIR